MAEKLDPKELVSFKELLMANSIQIDAEDEEYSNIMNELWELLLGPHRLRVVK
jgi:hypothetical protein